MTAPTLAETVGYQDRAAVARRYADPRDVAELVPGDLFWHAPADGSTPPCWREVGTVDHEPSADWHPTGPTVVTDRLDPATPVRFEPGTVVLTIPASWAVR